MRYYRPFLKKLFISLLLTGMLSTAATAHETSLFAEDTVFVGQGQLYSSLTKNGGLFHSLNTGTLTLNKNLLVLISSDLQETGDNLLTNTNLNGYTLTISPSAATIRNISNEGNIPVALIGISGARNIVVDGNVNGTGRYLRFVNTHPVQNQCQPTFSIKNSSQQVVIKNAVVESNLRMYLDGTSNITYNATIYVGPANNKNIEVRNCVVRNSTSGFTGTPEAGVISSGAGNELLVADCDIMNFYSYGVRSHRSTGTVSVLNNHFYYDMPEPAAFIQHGVSIAQSANYRITGNYIGGSARNCGGLPWVNNGNEMDSVNSSGAINAISVESEAASAFVEDNVIRNFLVTGRHVGFQGIGILGSAVIKRNTIGDTAIANSILSLSTKFGIHGIHAEYGVFTVENNIVSNLASPMAGVDAGSNGIAVSPVINGSTVSGNIVSNIINNSHPMFWFSGSVAITGIHYSPLGNFSADNTCSNNLVHTLLATGNAPDIKVTGITVNTQSPLLVNNNKIYNLRNNSSKGFIHGIEYLTPAHFINNQLTLNNGNSSNEITIRGIYGNMTFDSSKFYYNSVYIGGQTSGSAYSTTLWLSGNNNKCLLRNNILYNERTGGSNLHYAASGIKYDQYSWPAGISNYNLFVSADTSKMMEWGTCCASQAISINKWRINTMGDSSSYGVASTVLPAQRFFKNLAAGDLNINNQDSICWYVNGKGLSVAFIPGDYDNPLGGRSISVADGATDIGSDEFNTNTLPPVAYIYGRHEPGGRDTLSVGGRITGIIQWGNSGILPDLTLARWYSGQQPNDTTNNNTSSGARFLSGYWQIEASGGSGYTYNATFFYDSAMLGRIGNANTMIINKKETGIRGSWESLAASVVNTTARTISVSGLNSFSEFTATDANAPLQTFTVATCSGGNATLVAETSGSSFQWQVDTGSGFTNMSDNSQYTGTATQTLTITNIPSLWYGHQYRCLINGIPGLPKRVVLQNKWTGSAGNAWENPANWSCGLLPDPYSDVIIESGTVLVSTDVEVRSLQVKNGATIHVSAGKNIVVNH